MYHVNFELRPFVNRTVRVGECWLLTTLPSFIFKPNLSISHVNAILVVVVTCMTYVHRSGTCTLIRILNVEVCTLSSDNVLLYFYFICVAERRRR